MKNQLFYRIIRSWASMRSVYNFFRAARTALTFMVLYVAASGASAATYCGSTNVQDVICYSDGACYITASAYGGNRYYYIAAANPNKNLMVSVALAMFTANGKVRIAFAPNGLNCDDIPLNTEINGVGATK